MKKIFCVLFTCLSISYSAFACEKMPDIEYDKRYDINSESGYLAYMILGPQQHEFIIIGIQINEAEQRKGNGRKLVLEALRIAQEHRNMIDVISLISHYSALAFWQAMGFSPPNSALLGHWQFIPMLLHVSQLDYVIGILESGENVPLSQAQNILTHQNFYLPISSAIVVSVLLLIGASYI